MKNSNRRAVDLRRDPRLIALTFFALAALPGFYDFAFAQETAAPAAPTDAGEPQALEATVVESTTKPQPQAPPRPRPAPAPAPEPEPLVISDVYPTVSSGLIVNEVSALKTGTPLIDTPQSLTVFTAERIEDQGITSIAQIIEYTPGVTTSQGEGHRDSIVFRGNRSTADFYVDGLRDDVQYYRPLYNVERVEILRGASALHFGRGGTGGILNRVMERPVIGEQFTEYETSVDTFGATLGQFDYNQSLYRGGMEPGKGGKTVIEEPWAAFRLNGFYEYLNNHRDYYDGNRFGINPTMAFELGPDTRLDLSYEFNDHERFIDRGIPTGANGRPVEALAGTVFGDPDQNFDDFLSHTIRADLNHEINANWKARVTGFYGNYDKTYQNFFISAYNEPLNQVTLDGYVDSTARESFVINGDLIGEFDTGNVGHTVIIGGEYINTSSDQFRFNSNWDTTGTNTEIFSAANFRLSNGSAINSGGNLATNNFTTTLNDDTRVDVDTYSFYFQDEVALTPWLDLVAGGRFDIFDIEVFNAVNNQTRTRKDEEVSPRYGLIVKPIENVSVYGSYSESFLPRSGEQYSDINGANNALDPNTYSNLEAGIKWDIEPDLSLTLAVFKGEESSPQVADNNPATLDVIDTETTGFEAQLTGFITDKWYIAPGYSYLDGEQVNRGGPTGLRPRELPEHTFSIWNRYQATDRLGYGLGIVHQDNSFANNNNTAVLPQFTRVDAAVYYKLSDTWSVQFNIENLFDTLYFPSSHSTHDVTVGRPINAAVSLKGRF